MLLLNICQQYLPPLQRPEKIYLPLEKSPSTGISLIRASVSLIMYSFLSILYFPENTKTLDGTGSAKAYS
jgi:hypothetical protein